MSQPEPTNAETKLLGCDITEGFRDWMRRAGGVLAISTYQAGKVVMVGWDGRQVTVLPRDFDRAMGMAAEGPRLALATRHEVTLFANAPALAYEFQEGQPGRYDALYLPRVTYHTSDLGVHDLAFGREGLWIVATRFSCLATLSPEYHFLPRWRPPFVSADVPEDRCHLNGLALEDGRPRYVTAFGRSDAVGGWRSMRLQGGMVLDVETGEPVAVGLCMPHSPRLHAGWLWVLNSGTGELLKVDRRTGGREVICALPGYLRGLSFVERYALVGLGTIREQHIFGDLPVVERFSRLRCGVAVVDLISGQSLGFFEFTSGCTELYEVLFLPGIHRPMILNLTNEPLWRSITAPDLAYWLRPSALVSDDSGQPRPA